MRARRIVIATTGCPLLLVAMVLLGTGAADATQAMRRGSLQGCVAGEFILIDSEEEADDVADGVIEISEFDLPPALDVDWESFEGKTVRVEFHHGDSGVPPRVRRVTRLTGPPQVVGPCRPAALARLGTVLHEQAELRSRDIDPHKDVSLPLSRREQAAGNYAADLIDRAMKIAPDNCEFAVSRAFILEGNRRPDDALAQLEKTRRDMKCDPLVERVARSTRPASRLPVEPASEAEIEAWEKSR
jgi:hypothetical protein